MTNAQTPMGSGSASNVSSPRRARAISQDVRAAGDTACRVCLPWRQVGFFSVNKDDFGHAVCLPAMGWPASEGLYGVDGPGTHLERKISDPGNLRGSPHTHSVARQQVVGPIAAAVVAAGAISVPQH